MRLSIGAPAGLAEDFMIHSRFSVKSLAAAASLRIYSGAEAAWILPSLSEAMTFVTTWRLLSKKRPMVVRRKSVSPSRTHARYARDRALKLAPRHALVQRAAA